MGIIGNDNFSTRHSRFGKPTTHFRFPPNKVELISMVCVRLELFAMLNKRYGITLTQYCIMNFVNRYGRLSRVEMANAHPCEKFYLSKLWIAEWMKMSHPTINRHITNLIDKGFIQDCPLFKYKLKNEIAAEFDKPLALQVEPIILLDMLMKGYFSFSMEQYAILEYLTGKAALTLRKSSDHKAVSRALLIESKTAKTGIEKLVDRGFFKDLETSNEYQLLTWLYTEWDESKMQEYL